MTLEDRITEHARSGLACIRCNQKDGTVCGRHYNGAYQHRLGKGRGLKCHPFAIADFCNACDAEFQEGAIPKSRALARIEKSEEFLAFCLLSTIRREQEGHLVWQR